MTNADLVPNRIAPPGGWSCTCDACPNGELSPLRDSCQSSTRAFGPSKPGHPAHRQLTPMGKCNCR
ncbi:MAG: hypothetical protein ACI87O_001420 [Planctomycetota bacterium]|jgi:hypothetical protein